MRQAHLHLVIRDGPDRALEVELLPFGMAQLAGTNKDMRKQAQGHSDDRMSVVVLYGPHQRAHFSGRRDCCAVNDLRGHQGSAKRSEEHTSELQSLMRISYAVFCLTK